MSAGTAVVASAALSVPTVEPGTDTLAAALSYATAGWYVVPVRAGSKHPGSVVGRDWQHQSSREPEQLAAWWAGTDHGIALHVGRSGAVVFDVDRPDRVPDVLTAAIKAHQPPRQTTRPNNPGRVHAVFAVPLGRRFGNGTGRLGGAWGEVRGDNGVIVVSPSVHQYAADGAAYGWAHGGPVPVLPDKLADLLPDGADAAVAATDTQVSSFLAAHHELERPDLLEVWCRTYTAKIGTGASRHDSMLSVAAGAMKEAAAGYIAAQVAADTLGSLFLTAVARQPAGERQGAARSGALARSEWAGILSWAVGQAEVADLAAVRARVADKVPTTPTASLVASDWLPPLEDPPSEQEAAMDTAAAFARDVDRQAYDLRVRDAARTKVAAERAGDAPGFDAGLLGELLARPAEPPHRVDGLIPSDAGTLFVAARKTGKTTVELNLARAKITGEDFLGRFAVRPLTGRVGFLNFEVSAGQLARWADEVGVPRDRMYVVNLRGRRNPLGNPDDRAQLAEQLHAHEVESLMVDPFGRAYTGQSQNDPGEVGAWLADLDRWARGDAGVCDLILSAHAGWNGERTRGASALEDWADSIITLVRDPDDDSVRYLRAEGRDVLVEEDRLDYDPITRRMSLAGAGSRRQASASRKLDELVSAVVAAVSATPGMNGSQVGQRLTDSGVGWQKGTERKALAAAVDRGLLVVEPGPRGAKQYHLPRPTPTYPGGARPTYPDPTHIGGVGGEGTSAPDLPRGVNGTDPATTIDGCPDCGRDLDVNPAPSCGCPDLHGTGVNP